MLEIEFTKSWFSSRSSPLSIFFIWLKKWAFVASSQLVTCE